MTETPLSKVSRMIQAGHMRVTRRLPRPVKRRLSWKTTRENLVRWHQHALWDRRAHDQGVDCVVTIHNENQGDSAWTGEILDETKSDLEPRKQSACKMFLPRTMSTSSWSMAESSRIERRARRSNENACVTDVSDTCMPASCCQVDWRSASAR